MLSRIRYASEIFYPYISKSAKKSIGSAIRSMNRMIYKIAQNSPTKYADQITNFIPIGIKAVIQKVKLMQKMEKYYPKELKRYEEVFESDI